MEEWTEKDFQNKNLVAPCGLYCGVCAVYMATRDNNAAFKNTLATRVYGTKPEETECLGCMQQGPDATLFPYCRTCGIRECVRAKGYDSCYPCSEWPCQMINDFPLPVGRRVILRTVPLWREKVAALGPEEGTLAWIRAECERYHCPSCGDPLFRGAQRCRGCGSPVADRLDGKPTD